MPVTAALCPPTITDKLGCVLKCRNYDRGARHNVELSFDLMTQKCTLDVRVADFKRRRHVRLTKASLRRLSIRALINCQHPTASTALRMSVYLSRIYDYLVRFTGIKFCYQMAQKSAKMPNRNNAKKSLKVLSTVAQFHIALPINSDLVIDGVTCHNGN